MGVVDIRNLDKQMKNGNMIMVMSNFFNEFEKQGVNL